MCGIVVKFRQRVFGWIPAYIGLGPVLSGDLWLQTLAKKAGELCLKLLPMILDDLTSGVMQDEMSWILLSWMYLLYIKRL